MKTYTANVELDGKFWYIRVPELGHSTQARNMREIESMARDLIAVMNQAAPDSFDLTVNIHLPESVQSKLDRARRRRADAAAANADAAQAARDAAKELAGSLTIREVGEVLGVSHQRAHQLVNG